MATRTVRLGVTVGVPDPSTSVAEVKDAEGRVIRPASIGTRYILAGEEVELESEEADRLQARHPFRPVVVQPVGAVVTKTVR